MWRASLLNHCWEVWHVSVEAADGMIHWDLLPLGASAAGSTLWVCGAGGPCATSLTARSGNGDTGDTGSDFLGPATAPASRKHEISAVKSKKEKISPSRTLYISIFLLFFTEVTFHLTLLMVVQTPSTTTPEGEFLQRGLLQALADASSDTLHGTVSKGTQSMH